MKRPLKPGVSGSAVFRAVDGINVARLRLDRWWDIATIDGRPSMAWRPLVMIGINPSDAGGDEDDNTSAKFETFARREGANGTVIVNIHPAVSKDPDAIGNILLPYGCDEANWEAVDSALCENAVAVIAAMGKPPKQLASYRDRVARLKRIAGDVGVPLMCFGTNEDGSPKHPLYLKGTTPIVPWWSSR